MITSTEWAAIKREIASQVMQVLLSGNTADTQVDDVVGTESIDNSPPGMPTIKGRPLAHPYGLVSRAPKGTAQVVARQGSHPGNRIVLLHRDKNRPTLSAAGEVMLYDAFGNQIYLKDGEIQVGKDATKEAARKGDTVRIKIPSGTFIGSVGGQGTAIPSTTDAFFDGEITSGSDTVKIVD